MENIRQKLLDQIKFFDLDAAVKLSDELHEYENQGHMIIGSSNNLWSMLTGMILTAQGRKF